MNLFNFVNHKIIKNQFYKHSLSYDHDDFDKNMGNPWKPLSELKVYY